MNTINNTPNNRLSFTSRVKFAEGLGNKTMDKAAKVFEQLTPDEYTPAHTVLRMWEDGGVYKFDTKITEGLSPTTQYVGKDVLGYLLVECNFREIARFFKSTLDAVRARQAHHTGDSFVDNINANIDATMVYLRDKAIGQKLKTTFDGVTDYDKAGACIHLEG